MPIIDPGPLLHPYHDTPSTNKMSNTYMELFNKIPCFVQEMCTELGVEEDAFKKAVASYKPEEDMKDTLQILYENNGVMRGIRPAKKTLLKKSPTKSAPKKAVVKKAENSCARILTRGKRAGESCGKPGKEERDGEWVCARHNK